jgi:hypothetical protein
MSQFQLGMSLTFLKRDLAVVIQSTEKEIEATPKKKVTIKEYLLIPTKLPSSDDYVTFTELKKDFNNIFGTDSKEATDKITDQLKQSSTDGKFNIDNIHFYLKTAYLYKKAYYTKDGSADKECNSNGEVLKDTDEPAKWEYALSISIDSKAFFSEFNTMSINSISFSIWNTDRSVVKKMMTLGSTDDIFKQLEESSK